MDKDIIDLEEIIAKVAKKHQLLLTKDDPVFVTATLNKIVVESLIENASKAVDSLQDRLEEMYYRQSEESKETARRIMQATLNRASEVITENTDNASNNLIEKVTVQQNLFIAKCNEILQEQQKIKTVNVVFSCAAMASAVIAITALLVK